VDGSFKNSVLGMSWSED